MCARNVSCHSGVIHLLLKGEKVMTKVIKLQLYYKDDERLNFKKAQETLWQLQREVRAAANRAIQMCWEFNEFEADWKRKTENTLQKMKRENCSASPCNLSFMTRSRRTLPI